MMWWCGSGIAAAAISAQWLRAQRDHRGGGLHLFPQPSITHIHISKDRYKQTQPDAHPYTLPLCVIYTYFHKELPTMKRYDDVYYSCQIFGSRALIDATCVFLVSDRCVVYLDVRSILFKWTLFFFCHRIHLKGQKVMPKRWLFMIFPPTTSDSEVFIVNSHIQNACRHREGPDAKSCLLSYCHTCPKLCEVDLTAR